jgi:DNA segregation ATPase FtsK/SpoIIIE-like protein
VTPAGGLMHKGFWYFDTTAKEVEIMTDDQLFTKSINFLDYFRKTGEPVSMTVISRRFRVGFAQATRIKQRLEDEGYISKWDGKHPSVVLK